MTDEKNNSKDQSGGQTAPEPVEFEFMGKKFDLSTAEGRIEAKAWSEAFGTLHGKQTNELGELRKFKKRMEPAADTEKLLETLREKRDELGVDQLADLLLTHQAQLQKGFKEDLLKEKANERTWKKYLNSRKELVENFDEDLIRDFSERNLGIYDSDDPFAVLDAYWLPKAKKSKEFKSGTPIDTEDTANVSRVRSSVSSSTKVDKSTSEEDVGAILDGLHKKL